MPSESAAKPSQGQRREHTASTDYENNKVTLTVEIDPTFSYVLIPDGTTFTVSAFSITPGQDNDHHNAIGDVHQLAHDSSFSFSAGRHGSGDVADFWNNNIKASESTFNHGAGVLNFAFLGTLKLKVSTGATSIYGAFDNVGFAQGHSGSTNNWWFGQAGGSHVSPNEVNIVGVDGDGSKVTWTFLRGDNAVDQIALTGV